MLIISVTITSYLVKHHQKIYISNIKLLSLFDSIFPAFRHVGIKGEKAKKRKYILFGCDRMGKIILKNLEKLGKEMLIIDNNPEIVDSLLKEKKYCFYGDATNEEILKKIDFKNAKILISTMPNLDDNIFILKYAKSENEDLKIVLNAKNQDDAIRLYKEGASYVIIPLILSGEYVSKNISDIISHRGNFKILKKKHLKHLMEEFMASI